MWPLILQSQHTRWPRIFPTERKRERLHVVHSQTYVLCVLNQLDWARQTEKGDKRAKVRSLCDYQSLQTTTTLYRFNPLEAIQSFHSKNLFPTLSRTNACIVKHFKQTTIQRKHEQTTQIYKPRIGLYVNRILKNVEYMERKVSYVLYALHVEI